MASDGAAGKPAGETPGSVGEAKTLGAYRLSPLHVAVWMGDVDLVKAVLEAAPGCIDDRIPSYGASCHLAPAVGALEVVQLLMDKRASFLQRDVTGQRSAAYLLPMAFHDLDLTVKAWEYVQSQGNDAILGRGTALSRALEKVPDFECTIKFSFSSWIPLAGLLLPTDTLTLRKHGCNVRLDVSIVGFSAMQWQRGRVSFLFRGHTSDEHAIQLVALDHVRHTRADLMFMVTAYRQFTLLAQARAAAIEGGADLPPLTPAAGAELMGLEADRVPVLEHIHQRHAEAMADRVDMLLGNSLPLFDWWSRDVTFSRDIAWWSKKEVTEKVGAFPCAVFSMQHLQLRIDTSPAIWPDRLQEVNARREARKAAAPPKESATAELKAAVGQLRNLMGMGGQGDSAASLSARAEALAHSLQAAAGEEVTHASWRQAAVGGGADVATAVEGAVTAEDIALVATLCAPKAEGEGEEDDTPPSEGGAGALQELMASGGAAGVPGGAADPQLATAQLGTHRALAAQGWVPSAAAPMDGSDSMVEVTWQLDGNDSVSAGDFTVVAVPVTGGASATWSVTVPKHDIGVHAVFIPSASAVAGVLGLPTKESAPEEVGPLLVPRSIHSQDKAAAVNGRFAAPIGGALLVLLDNSYAFWHTKKVAVRLQLTLPTLRPVAEALAAEGGPLAPLADALSGEGGSAAAVESGAGGGPTKGRGKEVEGPFLLPPGSVWVDTPFESVFGLKPEQALAAPAAAPAQAPPTTLPGNKGSVPATPPTPPTDGAAAALPPTPSGGKSPAAVGPVPALPASWEGRSIADILTELSPPGAAPIADRLPSSKPSVSRRVAKRSVKVISAKVKMSDSFPLPVSYLLPVLEAVSRTSAHMENASRFLHTKLPPGFPVAFDVPVVPAVSAQVQFLSAEVREQDPELFTIPPTYTDLTPDLQGGEFFKNLGRVEEEEAAASTPTEGAGAAAEEGE